jgi:hypothetical protein
MFDNSVKSGKNKGERAMKAVVTFMDVNNLNSFLEEKGFPVKMHLRDSCGAQALWFEETEHDLNRLQSLIKAFFALKGMQAHFINEGRDFLLQPMDD